MRYAEWTWVVALLVLGVYELWALWTGHTTLSRAVWTMESSPYGSLIPLLAGVLMGHFFTVSLKTFLAFAYGFGAGKFFWHVVNPPQNYPHIPR